MRAPDGQLPQIKIRVSEALRSKLESAAAEKPWPLNREISARLEASFSGEEKFGSRVNAAMFRVLGQAITDLEERIGARWTQDYAAWWAARDLITAHVAQFMPPPSESVRIAELRHEEESAEAELRASAASYNAIYSPVFEDNFQSIYPWDREIESGTFDCQFGNDREQAKRNAYLKVYNCNQKLSDIRKQINLLVIPYLEQQKQLAKIAHEVLENVNKKLSNGKTV